MSQLDEMWVLTQDDYAVIKKWDAEKACLQEAPGFGCRLEYFDPDQYDAEWCRQRKEALSMSAGAFTIIYVGRFVAFKGIDRVARLYWELKWRGADVQLVLLGAFDDLHPSGLNATEVELLENDPSVIIPGWQESVAQWLAIADLCVFPSEREGMPVCLMESISMGVPVITSNSRGCRDVVRDGIDGYIVQDTTVISLADKIESLMMDSPTMKSLSLASKSGRCRFDRKCFVSEQLSALDAALATN
jgi:glycosyltransferase involved in cell wall biosynthesis